MAKITGFKRRRNYYLMKDVIDTHRQSIKTYQKHLVLVNNLGILSIDDEQYELSKFYKDFNKILKEDFDSFFEHFLLKKFELGKYNKVFKHNKKKVKDLFVKYFKIRTASLPNIHVIYWLKLLDLEFIFNDFLVFIQNFNLKKYDLSNLKAIKNIQYLQISNGSLLIIYNNKPPPRCTNTFQNKFTKMSPLILTPKKTKK